MPDARGTAAVSRAATFYSASRLHTVARADRRIGHVLALRSALNAPAMPPGFVGMPMARVEDLRLLRGEGRYIDDVHAEGMLCAAILRSVVAHGTVRAVDARAARAMPGVRGIYTGEDIAKASGGAIPTIPLRLFALPEAVPFEQPVIAHRKVRYVGEPLAIVVADSAAQAADALEAVGVDIDPLDAVVDPQPDAGAGALLFEAHGSNLALSYLVTKGDAGAAAPYARRESFSVQRHTAVCMEPRGLLASWDSARTLLTVAGAAKVPYSTRRVLAKNMDLPEDCVEMTESDVGGGFGVRGEFYPEDFLVPFAARRLGRPVKWIEDRRENLLASNHSREAECEVEIACERDGTIVALRGCVRVDMGAYLRASAVIPARCAAQFLSGPYRIPNVRVESFALLSNKTPIGTYRGPGRFEADFFRERLFDLAARDLGIDPLEFRRRNLPTAQEMPYALATINKPEKQPVLDSGDFHMTLERCLEEIGWREKAGLQGRLVDGRYHGLAVACFMAGGAAGPKETARIDLSPDGTVAVYVGSTSIGQGLETICTQIAADALQVHPRHIRVLHGSTTQLKEGFGSYHSRSTVMGGSAILATAATLRERLRAAAARRLGCAAEEVELGPALGARRLGAAGAPFLELGEFLDAPVSVDGSFSNQHVTYSYGAAAAHVAVDADTGCVEVVDYVNVEDIGRVINPMTAQGQAVGGIVQGLGGAFMEHLQYDEHGQLLTASLADYALPRAGDFPRIRAVVLEHAPSPCNPLGAKGGGEGSIAPVGGVIASAVASALAAFDVQPHSLPLTPQKIWQLINGEPR